MIKKNLSDSAFLVNESRARAEELSMDAYAKLWVDDAVRDLWCLFNNEVYSRDPRALAVRNRFFLGCLNRFFADHSQGVFINIAAGFTSYPYLMDHPPKTIEVDLPGVVDYKRIKVREFRETGCLPRRDVTYVAADLNCPKGREALFTALTDKIKGRPNFILLEGISYYLDPKAFFALLETASRLQTRGSELSMDYWLPGVEKNQVFIKFCDFLERRCNHPNRKYNLLTPLEMESIHGYEVGVQTDVSAFENQITDKPLLQTWEERLPENFITLVRT